MSFITKNNKICLFNKIIIMKKNIDKLNNINIFVE